MLRAIQQNLKQKKFKEYANNKDKSKKKNEDNEPKYKGRLTMKEILQLTPPDIGMAWHFEPFGELRRKLSKLSGNNYTYDAEDEISDDIIAMIKMKVEANQGNDVIKALHELVSISPNMVNKAIAPIALGICATHSSENASMENKLLLRFNALALVEVICDDGQLFLQFVNFCGDKNPVPSQISEPEAASPTATSTTIATTTTTTTTTTTSTTSTTSSRTTTTSSSYNSRSTSSYGSSKTNSSSSNTNKSRQEPPTTTTATTSANTTSTAAPNWDFSFRKTVQRWYVNKDPNELAKILAQPPPLTKEEKEAKAKAKAEAKQKQESLTSNKYSSGSSSATGNSRYSSSSSSSSSYGSSSKQTASKPATKDAAETGGQLGHADILKFAAPRKTGTGQGDFTALTSHLNITAKEQRRSLANGDANETIASAPGTPRGRGQPPATEKQAGQLGSANRSVSSSRYGSSAASSASAQKPSLGRRDSTISTTSIVSTSQADDDPQSPGADSKIPSKQPPIISYMVDLNTIQTTKDIDVAKELVLKHKFSPSLIHEELRDSKEAKPLWDALCETMELTDVIKNLTTIIAHQVTGRNEYRFRSTMPNSSSGYSSSYSSTSSLSSSHNSGSNYSSSSSYGSNRKNSSSSSSSGRYSSSTPDRSDTTTASSPATSSQSSPTIGDKKNGSTKGEKDDAILEEDENASPRTTAAIERQSGNNSSTNSALCKKAAVYNRIMSTAAYMQYLAVPPLEFLLALARYQDGKTMDSQGGRIPLEEGVINTLEKGFRMSVSRVEPWNFRIMLLIDTRSSMEYHKVQNDICNCRSAVGALIQYFINVCGSQEVGAIPPPMKSPSASDSKLPHDMTNMPQAKGPVVDGFVFTSARLSQLPFQPHWTMNKILKHTSVSSVSVLDITKGIEFAKDYGRKYDLFLVLTDDSADFSGRPPAEALAEYRKSARMPGARLVVINFAGNPKRSGLIDANDPGSMQVCGFNSECIEVIRMFMQGLF